MSDRFPHRGASRLLAALALGALATGLAGCTGSSSAQPAPTSASDPGNASAVIASLGAVPIPTAPAAEPTATASALHPTIVEMGAPVRASLPGGSTAVLTALGPVELTPEPGRKRTVGIITVAVTVIRGSVTVHAGDFSSRDETGAIVALTAQGAGSATATPGRAARLTVRGTYETGAAQMTWKYRRHVIAIWDFTIELD